MLENNVPMKREGRLVPALPRPWAEVSAIPTNRRGKTPLGSIYFGCVCSNFEFVKSTPFIYGDRGNPTDCKKAHNEKT